MKKMPGSDLHEYLDQVDPKAATFSDDNKKSNNSDIYGHISLSQPMICPPNALFIGSRLDNDLISKKDQRCRFIFYGTLARGFLLASDPASMKSPLTVYPKDHPFTGLFKRKQKIGQFDRVIQGFII